MGTLLMILGGVFFIIGFVCSMIVLIDAFKNEVWKGVLYLVCGFYGLYYAFAEFQNERKGLILLGLFGGAILGYGLWFAGMMANAPSMSRSTPFTP